MKKPFWLSLGLGINFLNQLIKLTLNLYLIIKFTLGTEGKKMATRFTALVVRVDEKGGGTTFLLRKSGVFGSRIAETVALFIWKREMYWHIISREPNVLKTYYTMMRPRIEYCIQAWTPVSKQGNWSRTLSKWLFPLKVPIIVVAAVVVVVVVSVCCHWQACALSVVSNNRFLRIEQEEKRNRRYLNRYS